MEHEHPKEFLEKCYLCKYFSLKTCPASSCQKGHGDPCYACALLKSGGWDQEKEEFKFLPDLSMEICKDFEIK